MDTSTVVDLGRQALWMTVLISAPLLGVALFRWLHNQYRTRLCFNTLHTGVVSKSAMRAELVISVITTLL